MKAEELYQFIEKEIAWVAPHESLSACLEKLQQEQLKCIAVMDQDKYMGSIHQVDLDGLNEQTKVIEYQYLFRNCGIANSKTTMDFLRVFAEQETDQLIILSDDFSLVGSLLMNDFFAFFRETPYMAFSGEEIIVQKKRLEFTYAEISQIIEANGAKLLGIFTQYIDTEMIQLSVRIDHNGMNEILQNLRRYNYEIISLHKQDQFHEKLKEYADYFDKFLNI